MSRRAVVAVTMLAVAVVAVCATIVVVVLSRESPATEAAAVPSQTPAPPSASASLPSGQVMDVSPQADMRYLASLSAAGLLGAADDEAQVIEVGRLVCAFLATNQGDVFDAAVVVYESGQATRVEAGTIASAAVGAYCPQYGERLSGGRPD